MLLVRIYTFVSINYLPSSCFAKCVDHNIGSILIEMKPRYITFPENASQVIDEATDHVYNCSVASSNRTTVQWLSSRGPIPECINVNSSASSCNNCFTENRPCVTSSVMVTEELFLVHSLILHLYNVTGNHSDQYTCKVQGIDAKLVRRNNLMIQQSIVVFVNVTTTTRTDVKVDDGNKIIIPLVSASVSTLILVMLVSTIIVMVKLFCYIKNPGGSQVTEDGNQEIELTATSPTKKVVKEDEWEFPREKLKLLQKIGKTVIANQMVYMRLVIRTYIHTGIGNFGQVLKAKAEGIVPDMPHVNIVAVKQSKGKQK